MMRWLIFIGFIAALYFGGQWLLDNPGDVTINWLGLEISMHIAVLGFALAVFTLAIGYLAVLIWRLATWPSRRRARKKHRTYKRGLEQLTRGVAALAMGDEKIAFEALKKAGLHLPGEPLPKLLTAQLLQRQGNHIDAQTQFRALMSHPTTAGIATRKVIEQHVQRREWHEAMNLTAEARKETPRDRWLAITMIDLSARAKDAAQMLALTEGWQWQSPLTKEERHRYAALAHYIASQTSTNAHKQEQSLRHAVGYAPDFLPAVIDYAHLKLAENAPRRARKWLLDAWKTKPSTLLIQPILDSISAESPRAQSRLMKPFMRGEQTAAHHVLAARQRIAVNEYTQARTALEKAIGLEETKESVLLMAEVESKLRDNQSANSWTARAVDAPAGTTWVCTSCGQQHVVWYTHCDACNQFDSLRYERPETRITSVEITTI
jgi:HemY protein